MPEKPPADLRELLIDAHAHFFFLKGAHAMRLRLWQIAPSAIVIDLPQGAPMRKTVLGFIPTIDGNGIYEIEGRVNPEGLPDQMPGTLRVDIEPGQVRRVNRRLYPRFSFTPPLDATATPGGEKKSIPVRIINFSAGGLRVESNRPLAPDKEHAFRFRIEIDDEIHDLMLPGRIVYALPMEGGHAYGVKFLFPKPKAAGGEAPVEALDQTVDLLGLVNLLLVRES